MTTKRKHKNIQPIPVQYLMSWAAGIGVYLLTAAQLQIGLRLGGIRVEPRVLVVVLVLSAVLILVPAILIILRLRADIMRQPQDQEQKKVASYALCAAAATIGALASWYFIAPTVVFGIMAVQHSYRQRIRGLDNVKTYRIVSLLAIGTVLIHPALTMLQLLLLKI